MSTVIDATFDGEVFRPSQPVALEPNTPVRLTVESTTPAERTEPKEPIMGEPYSSLKAMLAMRLDGPPDWSANIDKYLYGDPQAEEPRGEG